ncbi:hypothetical protein NEOLI_004883 [Neolecta irregularis DAH-3]|uniref:Uncharacterized protein n=1 Tax=Neolecta irregularis (strain DAH-3) TaxID=1198029 RepID=A0A1U7LUR6_NEOID|nr:hypothetical protein NEOLI_004883 [Neolecta irregularis DAH-3]|eukprot:OLL26384.1 hypothetical protein NEOLI_004883 [Neolecta irregularis DAH-3]
MKSSFRATQLFSSSIVQSSVQSINRQSSVVSRQSFNRQSINRQSSVVQSSVNQSSVNQSSVVSRQSFNRLSINRHSPVVSPPIHSQFTQSFSITHPLMTESSICFSSLLSFTQQVVQENIQLRSHLGHLLSPDLPSQCDFYKLQVSKLEKLLLKQTNNWSANREIYWEEYIRKLHTMLDQDLLSENTALQYKLTQLEESKSKGNIDTAEFTKDKVQITTKQYKNLINEMLFYKRQRDLLSEKLTAKVENSIRKLVSEISKLEKEDSKTRYAYDELLIAYKKIKQYVQINNKTEK